MLIDCASCVGRPTECGDCVVSVILGSHPQGVHLDDEVQTAVAVLAGNGLVPPLRLMPAGPDDPDEVAGDPPPSRRRRAG
jgi:hypothetical protein